MQNTIRKFGRSIQLTAGNQQYNRWYRFRLFNYFRSAMALFFITIYFNGWLHQIVPASKDHASLYLLTTISYLGICFIFMFLISLQKPQLERQVFVQTLLDIAAIVLLMHATGGIRSGVGMLLIISTSMTSLFLKKRLTILFAAIATLSVLAEQVLARFVDPNVIPAFPQAGMLGLLIFTSAFLTSYITKHLRATEQLAADTSQELESAVQMNEQIIHNMRTGIIVTSNDGRILMSNNAAARLLNRHSIPNHAYLEKISVALGQRFQQWLRSGTQNHQPIPQADGLPDIQPGFSSIDKQSPDSGKTLIFLEDATQLTQRFQQVKLASLGRLTASIAHEIRNPLAAINHAAQLLEESADNPADEKLTRIINTQAHRLNSIVENVLQLSRQQQGNAEQLELSEWLPQFKAEFINNQSLRDEQLQIVLAPQKLSILFDPTQLHQVFWNLCSNTINHSGLDKDEVLITISGNIDAEFHQPCIEISDNGPGIADEILTKVFEPFFTTSTSGTGLGLYITREVIETNRAKIRYIKPETSAPEKTQTGGACFRIYFMQADSNLNGHPATKTLR